MAQPTTACCIAHRAAPARVDTVLESLLDALAFQDVLIVLDNREHLIEQFDRAYAKGIALSIDDAFRLALAGRMDGQAPDGREGAY
ncbi:MAG: hypothetical protein ACRDPY_37755 [Streptosporangiaceae bacterium]